MRLIKSYKPEIVGVPIVSLPPTRDKEDITESFIFAASKHKQVAVKIPVLLDKEDTCQHPDIFFSVEALPMARDETDKASEVVILPIAEKVKTLEAEFEIHRPEPKENEVLRATTLNELFPLERPEPLFKVNIDSLKKSAAALGSKELVFHKLENGNLLILPSGEQSSRSAQALVAASKVAIQDDLPMNEEEDNEDQ